MTNLNYDINENLNYDIDEEKDSEIPFESTAQFLSQINMHITIIPQHSKLIDGIVPATPTNLSHNIAIGNTQRKEPPIVTTSFEDQVKEKLLARQSQNLNIDNSNIFSSHINPNIENSNNNHHSVYQYSNNLKGSINNYNKNKYNSNDFIQSKTQNIKNFTYHPNNLNQSKNNNNNNLQRKPLQSGNSYDNSDSNIPTTKINSSASEFSEIILFFF